MLADEHVVSVANFGAMPEKENNSNELRKAVETCKGQKGLTLYFPPGIYHFRDSKAIELRDTVMTGKFGHNPEKKMFYPYAPYVKGLDFADCEDLIINAEGAILLCDGWMEPVSLEHCRNITLNGLTIDYQRKPFSVGKVIKRGKVFFEVQIDPQYPISKGVPCTRTEFWNLTENRLIKNAAYSPKSKVIGPQKVRIIGIAPDEKGEILAMIVHSFHFRPAILIHEAENITLNNVSIHAQPGMGIVGHRSQNLIFNRVNILPTPGVYMSTNTDASHFTSCKGSITFDHCHFEGQGDDSTNIHNYYYTITKKLTQSIDNDMVEIRVDAPTATHAQVLDYPDVGDQLELTERDTLKPIKNFQVLEVKNFPQKWISEITLQGHLPADFKNYFLANITRLPQVIIRDCHFGNHLARGMLIKTRNVLIENNRIENTTGTGIHVGAEASWKEGIASADIIIRNNKIMECGGGNGTINGTAGIAVHIDAKNPTAIGVHKRITIENNHIEGKSNLIGISINNAEDVTISQNQIQGCQVGIKVKYSQKVKISKQLDTKIEIGPGVSDLRDSR